MKKSMLDRFRRALAMRRSSLQTWRSGAARPVPVPPDGSVSGEEPAGELSVLVELEHALEEIDHGTFGHCVVCAGEVEPERLALDFTTCVCLDHYSEAQKRALERDLEMAASVQQHLFPCCVPSLPGIEFAAHTQPAHIVSGDYYDFFSCPDAAQGVIIADVMGKGVAASMLMANLQASLRILGPEYDTLHGLAGRLNELFRYNLKQIRFITMFLMAIDAEARTLRYCNAGHNPPLRWNAAAGAVQRLRPTGPALGLLPAPPFRSETLRLQAGDLILLYTDGLVEARDGEGEAFGEARLAQLLQRHHAGGAADVLTGLRRALERFTGGTLQDDVTLAVINVT